jgi:hypothetical protein
MRAIDATQTHVVARALKLVRKIVKHHKRRTPRGWMCPMSSMPIPREPEPVVFWEPW